MIKHIEAEHTLYFLYFLVRTWLTNHPDPAKMQRCTSVVVQGIKYHTKTSGGSRNGAMGGGGGWLEGRPGAGPTHSPARGYGGAL